MSNISIFESILLYFLIFFKFLSFWMLFYCKLVCQMHVVVLPIKWYKSGLIDLSTIAASSLTAASITICCVSIITSFWFCSFSISSSWISQNSSWNSVKSFPGGLLGIPDDVRNFKFKLKTAAPQAGAKDDAAIVSDFCMAGLSSCSIVWLLSILILVQIKLIIN